jgi:hypothetical protein
MCRRKAAKLVLAVATLALAAPMVTAQQAENPAASRVPPSVKRVRLPGRFSARVVENALAGARRRLRDENCQRIYTDFEDPQGRPLRAALDRVGATGEEYLDTLVFYDGTRMSQCERRNVLAFTARGSQVIFVCAAQFQEAARHDPFFTEAALIHESLHSLGLGENPPTSVAITRRVMGRCG